MQWGDYNVSSRRNGEDLLKGGTGGGHSGQWRSQEEPEFPAHGD